MRLRGLLDRLARRYLFDLYTRERLERQAFFYNAFKALRFNGIGGDYAEFGSHGGNTFALAYGEARRHGHQAHLWAFDSFSGLPAPRGDEDAHPEWQEGKMATGVEEFHAICAANGIPRDAYTVVPGNYEQTLPTQRQPAEIALAYVDCDLYSSTASVLEFLAPRLKHGMIVAFDDYYCWSDTQPSGERRALLDFMVDGSRWNWLPYVPIGWSGASFALESR
ncbi:MAG: TylF/MycF/NovP-related O-methyltransferase [Gaiellaceae bacterium]|jgi:O-methyltransferase